MSNAIAWISRAGGEDWRNAFNGKYAAVATHSGGGGQKVLSAMRSQLQHLGTTVLARELLTHYQKALNPDSAKAVLEQLLSLSE
jgi:NAD(P)H-dependent FMN reductase